MNGHHAGSFCPCRPPLLPSPRYHAASVGFLPLAAGSGRSILRPAAQVPLESSLQPSPEQAAIIAARRAEPGGSLRVVAFAGSGETTALRLLAQVDRTPALYLAYNKSTQLAAQAHFPAHVACRTMHSLAFRAMRMFEQQHRLER